MNHVLCWLLSSNDYFVILSVDTRSGGDITEEDTYSTHGTTELLPTATQQGEFVWKPLNWIACIVDCFLSICYYR